MTEGAHADTIWSYEARMSPKTPAELWLVAVFTEKEWITFKYILIQYPHTR